MKDPYSVLGLDRDATAAEIKTAYRKLARELHPDHQPGNARAEEKFKHVSAAYSLLSDAQSRARYDLGEIDASGAPRRPRATASGSGRRNPFDKFFRDHDPRATGRDHDPRAAKRDHDSRDDSRFKRHAGIKVNGASVDYTLRISFIEAARGAIKNVGMTNGKRLKVSIPPGTRDGQVLRLRGQGMPGLGGGASGDALVEIAVEPHPMFHAEGDDVRAETPVTLAEAVLGGRIQADTVDGPVMVTVPAEANTGTILRLKGRGLARGDGTRGDHYAILKVVLPAQFDVEFKDFVRAWSERHPYAVRTEPGEPSEPADAGDKPGSKG